MQYHVKDLFYIWILISKFNANNGNNGNASQNIWDQMALFNQLILHNILFDKNNLSTPEIRANMAAMTDGQGDNTLVF